LLNSPLCTGWRSGEKEQPANTNLLLSNHALTRGDQRNVSPDEVDYIIANGEELHCAGAVQYQLLRKCLKPDPWIAWNRLEQLVGTVIVANPDTMEVITVYRNRREVGHYRLRQEHAPWRYAA